jgi:hypothetical protein
VTFSHYAEYNSRKSQFINYYKFMRLERFTYSDVKLTVCMYCWRDVLVTEFDREEKFNIHMA